MGLCQIPTQTMEWFQRPLSLEGRMTTHNWLKWVLPLLTADVMQQKRAAAPHCNGIYSAGCLFLAWDGDPCTQVPCFSKVFLNLWGRSSVWRLYALEDKLFGRQEWWSNEGMSNDFGEASPIPISAPSLQDFWKALCHLSSQLVQRVQEHVLSLCSVVMITQWSMSRDWVLW